MYQEPTILEEQITEKLMEQRAQGLVNLYFADPKYFKLDSEAIATANSDVEGLKKQVPIDFNSFSKKNKRFYKDLQSMRESICQEIEDYREKFLPASEDKDPKKLKAIFLETTKNLCTPTKKILIPRIKFDFYMNGKKERKLSKDDIEIWRERYEEDFSSNLPNYERGQGLFAFEDDFYKIVKKVSKLSEGNLEKELKIDDLIKIIRETIDVKKHRGFLSRALDFIFNQAHIAVSMTYYDPFDGGPILLGAYGTDFIDLMIKLNSELIYTEKLLNQDFNEQMFRKI